MSPHQFMWLTRSGCHHHLHYHLSIRFVSLNVPVYGFLLFPFAELKKVLDQMSLKILTPTSRYPYYSHGGIFCQIKLFSCLVELLMSAVLIPMTDFMLITLLSRSHYSSSYITSIIFSHLITVMSST